MVFAGTTLVVLLGTLIFYKDLTYKSISADKKDDIRLEVTNRTYLGEYN